MDYRTYVSRRPRDAVAAVNRYLKSVPSNETVRVYAVGGDGILFDCLNGMVHFKNAELTSVPYGIANDFVRAFGDGAKQAFRDIKKLSQAPSRYIDIIHCGANYGLIEVNVGLVGLTMIKANEILRFGNKNRLRKYTPAIYNISAVKALFASDVIKQNYSIMIDGNDMSGKYCNIHIANNACDGGSFVPSPYAIPNDGQLDAIFLKSCKRLEMIPMIKSRNNGQFEKYDAFVYKRCREVDIASDVPLCIQIDGESFYSKEIKLKIIPDGIKVFAPEGLDLVDFSHLAYKPAKEGAAAK